MENGVCYLTLTEKSFSKRAAFSFLEELSSEFYREFGTRIATATRPYSFIEFGEHQHTVPSHFRFITVGPLGVHFALFCYGIISSLLFWLNNIEKV